MRNPSIPPNGHISQGTSNFNPQSSSQRGGHISSSPNIRGAISSSGSSYSTTSTYGGPGLASSKVSTPVNPTPMYSGSSALAPRGGLGNSGQNIPVGQNSQGASMYPSSGHVHPSSSPSAAPYIPVGCALPGGAVSSSSSLQPSPGSVQSPYAPYSGSHPISSGNQRGAVPSSSLQPGVGSVSSPYGSPFKPYGN
jgi:hypothetical protein